MGNQYLLASAAMPSSFSYENCIGEPKGKGCGGVEVRLHQCMVFTEVSVRTWKLSYWVHNGTTG